MAQVTVEGTVSKVFASRGFSLRETFEKRDGGTITRYWNVFVPDGAPVTVTPDETVKVTGLLQTEVSKRDTRYVDSKVSNATVERSGNAHVPHAAEHGDSRNTDPVDYGTPPEDPWANQHQWETAAIPDDSSTPF